MAGTKREEVEETLKRIEAHKGVIGTILVNAEGIPIRTTLDHHTTVQYVRLLRNLTMMARSTVRDIDPQNDLTFLRIRTKKHEILVAPENDYLLIVIQNPCVSVRELVSEVTSALLLVLIRQVFPRSQSVPAGYEGMEVMTVDVCVLRGMHGLVEVLRKGLRCEPLPGPIPSILHRIGLLFLRRSSNAVLEAPELPVWLSLHKFCFFMMRGQGSTLLSISSAEYGVVKGAGGVGGEGAFLLPRTAGGETLRSLIILLLFLLFRARSSSRWATVVRPHTRRKSTFFGERFGQVQFAEQPAVLLENLIIHQHAVGRLALSLPHRRRRGCGTPSHQVGAGTGNRRRHTGPLVEVIDVMPEPASCKLAPLCEVYLSVPSPLPLPPSSSFSPQLKGGLLALVSPGGGRLGGVGGLSFLRESVGVSTREAGFHSVVGGAGGLWGPLGEIRGGGAPRHGGDLRPISSGPSLSCPCPRCRVNHAASLAL
ncbi:hypothetical protein FQN60_014158 [Etheostoma spectabile]|uniref:Roadblock/LAMTOR2 domain-containing protein n=1 Tax=Etheostoma spectabile TaxID=54343 RepID=A0A5J5D9X0_9PERO|nr:hypothetical protein FQN60_014158 [Etheostoma spectabile]